MRTNVHKTVQLGELVAAALDWAAQHSSDPRVVSLVATKAVMHLLRRARKTSPSRQTAELSPLGDFGELLAFEVAGQQPGPLTSKGGEGARR
jgi:hypothetical protein